jgi:hypothetical protein
VWVRPEPRSIFPSTADDGCLADTFDLNTASQRSVTIFYASAGAIDRIFGRKFSTNSPPRQGLATTAATLARRTGPPRTAAFDYDVLDVGHDHPDAEIHGLLPRLSTISSDNNAIVHKLSQGIARNWTKFKELHFVILR